MENDKNFYELTSVNADTAPEQELRKLVKHLQDQIKDGTYVYWVGEWNNARRAKSTRSGEFVKNEDVIDYLKNN